MKGTITWGSKIISAVSETTDGNSLGRSLLYWCGVRWAWTTAATQLWEKQICA